MEAQEPSGRFSADRYPVTGGMRSARAAHLFMPGGEAHPAWFALYALAAVIPLAYATRIRETGWVVAAFLLALVPFTLVLVLAWALQSHRTRQGTSRRWAFLWGFLAATAASSYVNGLVGAPGWQAIVLLAPFVEELAKGAGLLLLLRFGRIRSILDGVIYALLIGGGFSLLENTFYFVNAISSEISGDDGVLRDVFIMRGIVSPLAHPIFLGAFAVALGSRRGRHPVTAACALLLGVGLHSLWNYAALEGVVTKLVPHTVALSLTLVSAALLLVLREKQRDTAPENFEQRQPEDDCHVPGDTLPTEDWFAPLPWYAHASVGAGLTDEGTFASTDRLKTGTVPGMGTDRTPEELPEQ